MRWTRFLCATAILGLAATPWVHGGGKDGDGLVVDKNAKTVTIAAKVAPRQLPNLKQVYPLEVVATFPAPKGRKAHETVVTFDAKPSDVHKALESLGLVLGKVTTKQGRQA